MDLLGFPVTKTVFTERRSLKKDIDIQSLMSEGFELLGRHFQADVVLFKKNGQYVLLNSAATDRSIPEAIGVSVANVDAVIEKAWQDERFDVFDGGAVGSMQLHLNALRTPQNQLIYLIENGDEDRFYMIDFDESHS